MQALTLRLPVSRLLWALMSDEDRGPCDEWTGSLSQDGYGRVSYSDRKQYGTEVASRVAWIKEYGAISPGLIVCHHCDNPPCCRLSHLFVDTKSANMHDRDEKHRGRTVLTPALVREIRAKAKLGTVGAGGESGNIEEIAAEYGQTGRNIRKIVNRERWSRVSD